MPIMGDAPMPDLKRGLQALSWAAALWCAGCSPRAFDDLPGPSSTSDAEAAATEGADASTDPDEGVGGGAGARVDAGDSLDAESEADVASMAGEDASTGAEDAEPLDATDTDDAGDETACPAPPGAGHMFKVKGTRELGPLPIPPAAPSRTVAGSARVGDKILWSFHNASFPTEPLMSHPSAALSSVEAPLALTDLADPTGTPLPFLERTAGEDANFALAPRSVVATSEHAALLFFVRIYVLLDVGVGVAHVDEQGDTTREPELLFDSDSEALFHLGAFVDDGYLYLYSSEARTNDPNSPLSAVVRAPVLDAARPGSYRTWSADERAWVTDLGKRSAVLSRVPNALSVSYNRFLGGYLAVYSALSGDAIELHLAPAPQGPFRALASVRTEPSPFADIPTFYAQQHGALGDGCDQRVVVSYTLPTARELTVLGPVATATETRLLEIAFQ